MIVGFSIVDLQGHKDDAIEFIRRNCILDNQEIAVNIVEAGSGVNVYANDLTTEILEGLPFEVSPIEVNYGKVLLVSAVNFNLEITYNNRPLRLKPTEYREINPNEVAQFLLEIKQRLVVTFPKVPTDIEELQRWILAYGSWDDNGYWIDSERWRDSDE